MKYLIVILMISSGIGIKWERLEEFDASYRKYSRAAQGVLSGTSRTISDIRARSIDFVNVFFNNSMEYDMSNNFVRHDCTRIIINYLNTKRSFLNQVIRSERPLIRRLDQLHEKLAEMKELIALYHDLAHSKYWTCRIMSQDCTESINVWLDEVISKIACRLTADCKDRTRREKRRTNPCIPGEFSCKNGNCVNRRWICDGHDDCEDGSDEPAGCANSCAKGFHCFRTLRCIARSLICNGFNDCGDWSDELNCWGKMEENTDDSDCSIERGRFNCSDDKCIDIAKVCDGKKDCEEGTDEGNYCGKGHCPEECTLSGRVCFHGPQGPLCFPDCPLGTFEHQEGCTTHPYDYNSTVLDLLDIIPVMAVRHITKFSYLITKTLPVFSKGLSNVIRCQRRRLSPPTDLE